MTRLMVDETPSRRTRDVAKVTPRTALGVVLVVVGLVLALVFANLEVLWFTGRPFGILLVVLGAYEILRSRGARGTDR